MDTNDKWKELREEVHGNEKVNWLHVAKVVSYTWNKAVWLGRTTERNLFYATIRGRKTATVHQIVGKYPGAYTRGRVLPNLGTSQVRSWVPRVA